MARIEKLRGTDVRNREDHKRICPDGTGPFDSSIGDAAPSGNQGHAVRRSFVPAARSYRPDGCAAPSSRPSGSASTTAPRSASRTSPWTSTRASVTAIIGPSGCGKSTFLRSINRMNDLIPGARTEGPAGRRRPGHLRQADQPGQPPPAGRHGLPEAQSRSPRASSTTSPTARASTASAAAAAWTRSSSEPARRGPVGRGEGRPAQVRPGPVRRAAAAAVHRPGPGQPSPKVLLMDEPCSALDPIATGRIEDLIGELQEHLHHRHRHPQHAAGRPRQRPHGLLLPGRADRVRPHRATSSPTPRKKQTEDYITGRFG